MHNNQCIIQIDFFFWRCFESMPHMSNYITSINFSFITSILRHAKTLLEGILTMYIPRKTMFIQL